MLRFLHVRNFALAEDLSIEFQPGLNILTGETGAGKSILVGAIGAVLGERVFTEVVRTGSEKAIVEAVFDISRVPGVKRLLADRGIDAEEELFLRREISVKGSTRAFVNDSPVPIATLAEIGNHLVDIHGQHQHQSLLRPETHRFFLDAFGKLTGPLADVRKQFEELRCIEKDLHALQRREKELNEKYSLYEFQLREIENARLEVGEDQKLEEERHILSNTEKLFEIAGKLKQIFDSEDFGLLQSMAEAQVLLRELGSFSEELAKLSEEFSSAKIVVDETARSVEEFQQRLEFDPARLEEIEARLNQIKMLKKKYGPRIEDILEFYQNIRKEVNLKENFELEIQRLEKQRREAKGTFAEAVLQLSEARKSIARELERAVESELSALGMPRTRLQVRISWVASENGPFEREGKSYHADEFGADQVEFFISPNPGEDFKPLSKIASGGEISRIMLALKSILAAIDRVPTLIFDEIDLGVSGRIAQAVGRSIFNLSASHQILCITHLPQIASQGATHFTVQKFIENERTFTRVMQLSLEQRVEEIARLLSGERITETVMESARQLIEEGK